MTVSLEELLKKAEGLISFPEVCIRINTMVDDPRVSAADIGKVIQQDPALTARLLKIANSPLYGFASEIDTVSRAVTVLGSKEIRDLAFATSAIKAFDVKPGLEAIEELWSHNIYCAIACRQLAESSPGGRTESIFIAGLLHDIGRLLFISLLPEDISTKIQHLSATGHGESNLYLAEREVIGFDHAEAGGELIRQWNLPDSLFECVRYHHEPSKADQHPLEVAIVHLADCVAHAVQDETEIDQQLAAVDPSSWEQTGLTLEDLETVLPVVKSQSGEVRSLLYGGQ
jgi:HD-like signal output (HDOD) protein